MERTNELLTQRGLVDLKRGLARLMTLYECHEQTLSWIKQDDEIFADYHPVSPSPVIMQEFRSCFFANDDHISEITRKENNTRRHNQKENKEGKK